MHDDVFLLNNFYQNKNINGVVESFSDINSVPRLASSSASKNTYYCGIDDGEMTEVWQRPTEIETGRMDQLGLVKVHPFSTMSFEY